ncbi:hypothetical protein SUDANB121_01568 [Nocardiopsis dassonvillei]|uniref:alpha/beta fold hydrolase n=1 Tax=Nocardiopsis dassonvillei TaxID=2014 RepID=UPI003F546515
MSPLSVTPVRQARSVYRSAVGEVVVRAWCEAALAREPGLRSSLVTASGRTAGVHVLPGGPATPVLLLSGELLGTANLVPALRSLAEDRTVVSADLPGLPGTGDASRSALHRAGALGVWLDDLLPRVTETPVIVLGHGIGAVAALTATPSPLVAALVLVGPDGLAAPVPDLGRTRAAWAWRLSPNARTAAGLLDALGTPPDRSGHHPLSVWTALVGRHCRAEPVPGLLRGEEFRDWSRTPVTVAAGEHDRVLTPSLLSGPARRLLGTGVRVLRGAGHLALHDAPEAVRRLLREADPHR